MSEFKVFYSWQSDLPNATNRTFIQDALEKACKQVSVNPDIEVAPRVDQDTKDLSGAPLIPTAIMEKIDQCQAFVADVSLCFEGPDGKVAPNPNVVYELGYAVARLGWDRIILVVNEQYGKVERLPFDLEKRRAIPYASKEGEQDRSEIKKALVGRLAAGIEAIARRQPIVPMRTPADVAIEAVENQSPSRKARIRELWAWVMAELHRLEPDLRSAPPEGEHLGIQIDALKEAIANTGPLLRNWTRVCDAISLVSDEIAASTMTRGFEEILPEYDVKPRTGMQGYYKTWFDYWRFVGHELYTIWIASLLKERCWDIVGASLSEQYYINSNPQPSNYGALSVYVELFGIESERLRRASVHSEILAVRHNDGGVASCIGLADFVSADLLLYLAARSRFGNEFGFMTWRPWSLLYLDRLPKFLLEARRRPVAEGVKLVLGQSDSTRVRELIKTGLTEVGDLWPKSGFRGRLIDPTAISEFDTLP